MNENSQLKTYNNNHLQTPISNSFFSEENRISMLKKNIKDKILSQNGNIFSLNSTIKKSNKKINDSNIYNNNMPNIFKSNTNRIKTPNRNNNISNKIASYLSNNSYKLNLLLPSINNYLS
jgi:hypothetical protein